MRLLYKKAHTSLFQKKKPKNPSEPQTTQTQTEVKKKNPMYFKLIILQSSDITCCTEAWKSQYITKSDTIHKNKCHNQISLFWS